MKILRISILALLLALRLTGVALAADEPPASSLHQHDTSQDADPMVQLSAQVSQIVRDIEQKVSEIRQLSIEKPLKARLMTGDDLEKFALEEIAKQYPDDKLSAYDYFFRVWGLIPASTPRLLDLYLAAIREQVGGLYDPGSKTLFIMTGFDPGSMIGKIILAHEICHALQDQHFDLGKSIESDYGNEDSLLALQSVFEGDATLLMTEYMVFSGEEMDVSTVLSLLQSSQGQFYQMPYALQQLFIQPYLLGSKFMTDLTLMHQISRDEPFRNPPVSMEQVMHIDKYLSGTRDMPTSVTLVVRPEFERNGWEKGLSNSLGEFQIKLLMDVWHGFADGARIAAGWDGDVYAFYGNGAEYLTEIKSVWDTPNDAEEFFNGMNDLMQRRNTADIGYVPLGEPAAGAGVDTELARLSKAAEKSGGRVSTVAGANWGFIARIKNNEVHCLMASPQALKMLSE